jgi:hypothetical protein
MAAAKECSIDIGVHHHKFSRRIEESDILSRPRYADYIPFVVISTPKDPIEVLFTKDDEAIKELIGAHKYKLFARGCAFIHQNQTIHSIQFHSRLDSARAERELWIETVLNRINGFVLDKDSVWISDNEREFYVYRRPSNLYLKQKPVISPVEI